MKRFLMKEYRPNIWTTEDRLAVWSAILLGFAGLMVLALCHTH